MAYERLGESALDYYPCRYGKSKLLFRGPRKRLEKPYVAIIGGTETYGKFVENPFPNVLENSLGQPVVNLGCINAGIDAFSNDDAILGICSDAAVTVVQIPGAQNMSNRYYSVHPRRNDRFLKASRLLATIYSDVDFTEFHFTRHLLTELFEKSPEKFELVRQELKDAWVGRMIAMLNKIGGKIVLLWMADHAPGENPTNQPLGHDPMFVDRAMLEAISVRTLDLVEVAVQPDEVAAGFDRMIYTALEEPAAMEMLGPVAHEAVAKKLHDAVGRLLK